MAAFEIFKDNPNIKAYTGELGYKNYKRIREQYSILNSEVMDYMVLEVRMRLMEKFTSEDDEDVKIFPKPKNNKT